MRRPARGGIPPYLLPPPRRRLGLNATAWRVVLLAAGAAVVEAAPRLELVDAITLVPFSAMVTDAAGLLTDGDFYASAVLPSLYAILASFVMASAGGVLLGYAIWRAPAVRSALNPYLTAYYAVPTFALYPVLVVLWGAGHLPIIALTTVFAIVAVITSALNGYDSVPPVIRKVARSLLVTERQYFTRFFLPAAVPHILIGMRLAFLYSILNVLAAEFLLASQGLGHFVALAYTSFQTAEMYAGILVILTLSIVAERSITLLVNKLTWIGSIE